MTSRTLLPLDRDRHVSGPGEHYARSRARLSGLLDGLGDDAWGQPVAACPGWRVHDVVSHLFSNVEDALAGTLTGPPTEAQTAEQVARHRHDDPRQMVASWNQIAPPFEDVITELEIWPAAIDAVSHEHDIRGTLGNTDARDDDSVKLFARALVDRLDAPVNLTVITDDATLTSPAVDGEAITLQTSSFEVLRLRLGRRSLDQVRAMDWSADPEPLLGSLFLFGPTEVAISE